MSQQLPSTPFILFLRWGLPAIVCIGGLIAVIVSHGSDTSLEGGAAIVGAGSSLWLMNFLWRAGVVGDKHRDEEEAARRFFDEHGRWPD